MAAHLPARGPQNRVMRWLQKLCHRPTDVCKVGIPPRRDRLPCATGLASYPSSCVPFCKQASAGWRLRLRSELVARFAVTVRGPDGFLTSGSLRETWSPLRVPIA
jgi:hypothetical protein